jgi:hypothetical protein
MECPSLSIAISSQPCATLVPPARMPAWPWPFWSRQVDTLRWLGLNDVRSTGVHIWCRVFGEWPRYRRLSKKLFGVGGFRCGHCWWKLLVCFKTFIYCEQLCNNAVNYPSTPLTITKRPSENANFFQFYIHFLKWIWLLTMCCHERWIAVVITIVVLPMIPRVTKLLEKTIKIF